MNYQTYLSEPGTDSKAAQKRSLWDQLSTMKFAIWILIILGILSLIPLFVGELRDPNVPRQPGVGEALMMLFQMDNPFRSWWYRGLLGLLCLSLFACILERTPIIWRLWTKAPPQDAAWLSNIRHGIVRTATVGKDVLQSRFSGWSWRVKNDELWVGERGRLGMWGPLLTHLGMLLLGVGALTGSFGGVRDRMGGFAGDTLQVPHENFAIRIDSFRVVYYPLQPGQWAMVDQQWVGKLERKQDNGLWLVRKMLRGGEPGEVEAFAPERIRNRFNNEMDRSNIQKYISYVTVIEDGKEPEPRVIAVNSPLRRDGYRFYQSSYEPDKPRFVADFTAVRVAVHNATAGKVDTLTLRPGVPTAIPGDTVTVTATRMLPHFKLGRQGAYSETAEFHNPAVELVFRGTGGSSRSVWQFTKFPSIEREAGQFGYELVSMSGERASEELMTIWDVKKTHGGSLLWAGFIICSLGLILCFYFTHRVLYVEWTAAPGQARLTGISRKMAALFTRQLDHALAPYQTL